MEYIILAISLIGIVLGADNLVAGAVSIARKYKVSDLVIGAAIVGIGTSMPELVVSFLGAVQGNADVAIGNVVGSNIFNVLGILGLTALFFPIAVKKENIKFEIPFCIFLSVLLTALALNFFNGSVPTIGRLDGLVHLVLFAGFMWYSFNRDRSAGVQAVEETETENISSGACRILSCSRKEEYTAGIGKHCRFQHIQYQSDTRSQLPGDSPHLIWNNSHRLYGYDRRSNHPSHLWRQRQDKQTIWSLYVHMFHCL